MLSRDAGTNWSNPATRESLILRLRDPRDHLAWEKFVLLYGPLIRRVALGVGVTEDDALEIAQETLISVARSIDRFETTRGPGTFRGWLARLTRNQTLSRLRKRGLAKESLPKGRLDSKQSLEPQVIDPLERKFEHEYRRQLFLMAVETIQPKTRESNWQAFWQTAVEGRPVEEVAREIGIRPAQVYVARSRIVAALRREVQTLIEADS